MEVKNPKSLLAFFNQHNSRYPDVNEARILSIKTAHTLTDDEGVILPNKMMVEVLIAQLKVLLGGIEGLNKEIKNNYKQLQTTR